MTKCVYQHIGDDGAVLCDNYSDFSHGVISFCNQDSGCTGRKPTNADRIRSMTDEELSELIGDYIDCCICKKEIFKTTECPGSILIGEKNCYGVWLDWLKQEAKE